MNRSFRIFAPVEISEGGTEYRHVGEGIEQVVDGKRVTHLRFWGAVDSGELIFWDDEDPPDFPIIDDMSLPGDV